MGDTSDVYLPIINRNGRKVLLEESRVFQRSLELLQVRLAQDFLNLWAFSENMSYDRRIKYLSEALADLQAMYGTDAVAIASQYLDVMRNGEELAKVLAETPDPERIAASTRWALSYPSAQLLLYGAMQRYLMEPYRETIRQSAFAAGNGYARVPDPDACNFCLMLASRGAVYDSKKSALEVGLGKYSRSERSTREVKARKEGKAPDYGYHDNCKCDVIEVNGSTALPEANVALFDMWQTIFYPDSEPDGRLLETVDFNTAFPIWDKTIKENGLPWLSTSPIVP